MHKQQKYYKQKGYYLFAKGLGDKPIGEGSNISISDAKGNSLHLGFIYKNRVNLTDFSYKEFDTNLERKDISELTKRDLNREVMLLTGSSENYARKNAGHFPKSDIQNHQQVISTNSPEIEVGKTF